MIASTDLLLNTSLRPDLQWEAPSDFSVLEEARAVPMPYSPHDRHTKQRNPERLSNPTEVNTCHGTAPFQPQRTTPGASSHPQAMASSCVPP